MKTGSSVYIFFVVVALFFFFPNKRSVGKKRSGHVGSGRARSGQVGQVGSGRVRSGQVGSGQVHSSIVADNKPEHFSCTITVRRVQDAVVLNTPRILLLGTLVP